MNVLRPILTGLAILTVLVHAPSAAFGPKDSASKQQSRIRQKPLTQKEVALSAVDSATHVASHLAPEARGFLLSSAAGAIAKAKPAKATLLYKAAFSAAQKMTLLDPFNLRMGVQEGSVAGLANINPDLAAEWLMQVDRPQWTGYPTDDFRSRSAGLITDRLLKRNRKHDIDTLVDLFEYLGETGQYPYRAASRLLQFLHSRGQASRARDIFVQMIGVFQRDDQFPNSANEFADLILANATELPDSALMTAIRLVVEKARRNEEPNEQEKKDDDHARFLISSPAGSLTINQRSTYLALRLLPLATHLDPALASELEAQNPELDSLAKKLPAQQLAVWSKGSLATLHGSSNSDQFHEFQQIIDEQRILTDVEKRSGSDADEALQLSKRIQRPDLHALALAAVAKGLVKSDPHRSAALLDEARPALDTINDDGRKVEAIVSIASVWVELGNKARALSLLDHGYSLAGALLKKESAENDATEEKLLLGPASRLLIRLVRVEAMTNAYSAIARANSFSGTPALHALLLIEAARMILYEEPNQSP